MSQSGPNGGLSIRLRQLVPMDGANAQTILQEVKHAMIQVYEHNAKTLYFEQVYRKAYNLVLHKYGDLLYNCIATTMQENLMNEAGRLVGIPDENLLKELLGKWEHHKTSTLIFKDLFMYVDRVYVTQHNKAKIYVLGLRTFRDVVLFDERIRHRLRSLLLKHIREERFGNAVDHDLLRSTLNMLVDVGGIDGINVYNMEFEQHFLKETETFYLNESQKYIALNSCSEYLVKAEQRLNEESERVVNYLSSSTEAKLTEIVVHALIAQHAAALLAMDKNGQQMMENDKFEDLKRLYALFSRVPSTLDLLRASIGDFTKQRGLEIAAKFEKASEAVSFVKESLALEAKTSHILRACFRGEKKAEKAIQDAFDDFLNKDSHAANCLALYFDHMMRGDKALATEDLDETLDHVMSIFRHIQGKDVFEGSYRATYAKRLLSGKSVSEDSERLVHTLLQKECGHQYVTKLLGMSSDMKHSSVCMEKFRQEVDTTALPAELSVSVLTTGHWPVASLPQCELPIDACAMRDAFSASYLKSYEGRKLVWQTNMGSAIMKCDFPEGKRELSVSTYQMCMLMLFNSRTTVTLDAFRQQCKIPEVEMRRHLLSLCTPRLRILRKASKGKGISDDDSFTVNTEFTHKMRRINVPLISPKEVTPIESARVPETVEEDRRHLVEAAIVRIMKARRVFDFNGIVSEVTKQLSSRFAPEPQQIKKRIESLIERDFLVRDDENRKKFTYVA